MGFDLWKKKYLVRLIDDIKDKKILIKIYKIIVEQKIPFTRNNNGVFINLNAVDEDKLEIVYNFLLSLNI
jgi:hypothetical protein